ncbi:MAG: division/cell wall cluster transcriptional repressor MraZ [Syntrophales bacterium]|nr:division/cell wall cluster transcriptional repressor MraZ [Syntrophales bacterium]MDY0043064.1 division/cell wall cluster transcriptional repressor MraZ [Syntrophales bacterium]
MSYFRGRYYHNIDEKGRIIFPAKLYEVFAEKYDNRLVMTNWEGCLLVFPYAEWSVIEDKIYGQSIIRREVRDIQRLLMSGAVELTFDAQRRVLIPPSLRSYARLEKEIVTAGMGRSIEIWNRERFDLALDKTSKNIEDYNQFIADLGI